ncbi:MAG: hypothetical protein KY476_21925, partial [Planctomycetes bacterium]|nr:hypothetical protein [Planctomycetota bacterium]
MSSDRLQSVLKVLEELSVDEQRQLRNALDVRLGSKPPTEAAFNELLRARGILAPRGPGKPMKEDERAPLVHVDGEPVSETII